VLHVLVNNSGVTWGESIDTYPDSAWTKLLTLNVQRVFTLTQKLLPLLEKGGKRDGVGRVINVGLGPRLGLGLGAGFALRYSSTPAGREGGEGSARHAQLADRSDRVDQRS
jgi:NAD(P)-dependent dehydrogenase (short-subunit alcohol dehydrogenase family)